MKLKKNFIELKRTKKFAILICGLFVGGIFIGRVAETFRYSLNLHWIYQYGTVVSHLIFLGSLVWSFINSINMISQLKNEKKNFIIWLFTSFLPVLYFIIGLTISILKTIKSP